MFTHVLTLLLDATFSQLTDQKIRIEAYKLPPLTNPALPTARIEDITEALDPATATAKLATIMAVMTREARAIGSGVPNEYAQAIEGVSELEGFAAVVYSSNFEIEAGADVVSRVSAGAANASVGLDGSRTLEEMSVEEAEEALAASSGTGTGTGTGTGIIDRATGIADAAWGGFESVWGRVVGGGQQGPIVG